MNLWVHVWRIQGSLQLSSMELNEDLISRADVCSLVDSTLTAIKDVHLRLQYVSFFLDIPVSDAAIVNIVSMCTQLANDASTDDSEDVSTFLLQQIAANDTVIPVETILWIRTDTGRKSAHKRKLAASRSSRLGGSMGDVTGIVTATSVSSQGWTVDDLPVDAAPRQGTVLQPRVQGRVNEILGGIQLRQTRIPGSSQTCSSHFSRLASSCSPQASEQGDAERLLRSSEWLPCGRDPSYNPLSSLFSTAVHQEGEAEYFNMSVLSTDVTAQDFPATFFPRTMRGKETFIVVLPVRCISSSCDYSEVLVGDKRLRCLV